MEQRLRKGALGHSKRDKSRLRGKIQTFVQSSDVCAQALLLDDLRDLLVVHSVRLLDSWEEDVQSVQRPELVWVIGVDIATARLVEVQVIGLLNR